MVPFLTHAQDKKEQEYYENAIRETQNVLTDTTQREKAIQQSPEAQKADAQVKQLAGDQKTHEEYYKLASEIFGGYKDEESMKSSISNGTRDPAQFYDSLTPEQKAKIKELSEKLNPGVSPSHP